MKSPGVIYRKYRQIRKRLLYEFIQNSRQCIHVNCHYGQLLSYTDISGNHRYFSLCMYDTEMPDVCSAVGCNAFVPKYSREEIEKIFEDQLKNSETTRRLYPELYALEWVLDKELYEARKAPSIIGKLLVTLIIFLESLLKRTPGDRMSRTES